MVESIKNNCLIAIKESPAEMIDEVKWNEMDNNVVTDMHLTLADEVLSSVEEKKIAKEICDALTKFYKVKSLHNKIFLKMRLYILRIIKSTSMTDYINTLKILFSQLTMLSYKVEENERVELLL